MNASGLNRKVTNQLLNANILAFYKNGNFVNVKPFINFLNTNKVRRSGQISLTAFIENRSGFNANLSELFTAILETNMAFDYIPKQSFEESIFVIEKDLINWYFKHSYQFNNEELSVSHTCELLKVNSDELHKLLTNGTLTLIPKHSIEGKLEYAFHRDQVIELASKQHTSNQLVLEF